VRDRAEPTGVANSILTSFNRNFPKRNDGSADTLAFISSPEIVIALGLAGRLSFNPLTDTIDSGGKAVKLSPPKKADDLPKNGFVAPLGGYQAPAENGESVKIEVDPKSERLQLLDPFAPWDGKDFTELPLLVKAKGKCTTDHISPAGAWLKYRGHLDKISDNMFLGAVNAWSGEAGKTSNLLSGEKNQGIPQVARAYKAKGLRWIVVGDENYGEGSSREHAAMSPRFLGAAAIITRSFARIHETNLKKQGVLPLTFAEPSDYDKVREGDRISLLIKDLAPAKNVEAVLHHSDGKADRVALKHTLTAEQIAWFKAGSALNLLKQQKSR
jgi:aconitate hydratase